ncbi:MAG: hypothetical protein AAF358_14175 [Pseudomonadota bacterium]
MAIPKDTYDRLTFLATTGRGHSLNLGDELYSQDQDKAYTFYTFAHLFDQMDRLLHKLYQEVDFVPRQEPQGAENHAETMFDAIETLARSGRKQGGAA